MFCRYCGKDIPEGVTHCPYCQRYIQPISIEKDHKKKNPIGYVAVAFGIVLVLSALFANYYSTRQFFGIQPFGYWVTKYPYKNHAFPLAIMGILAFIAGAILSSQRQT